MPKRNLSAGLRLLLGLLGAVAVGSGGVIGATEVRIASKFWPDWHAVVVAAFCGLVIWAVCSCFEAPRVVASPFGGRVVLVPQRDAGEFVCPGLTNVEADGRYIERRCARILFDSPAAFCEAAPRVKG